MEPSQAASVSTSKDAVPASTRMELFLPVDGYWFWVQKPVLDLFYKHNCQGFPVAWDKESELGKKIFGYYSSIDVFQRAYVDIPAIHRCGYELIPHDTPCHFYMDVEWNGPHDYLHSKIQWILGKIRCKIVEIYKKNDIHFRVSCATRRKDCVEFQYKNSYHVVGNLIFACNHDDEIKNVIMETIQSCPGERDQWYVNDKCIVDMGVYTTNRLFRMLGSTKKVF